MQLETPCDYTIATSTALVLQSGRPALKALSFLRLDKRTELAYSQAQLKFSKEKGRGGGAIKIDFYCHRVGCL